MRVFFILCQRETTVWEKHTQEIRKADVAKNIRFISNLFLSFIKFIPCLPANEEGEQENTEAHHGSAHGSEQRPEAEAPLEVNAGRYKNTVGNERTVHPAETHRKGEGEPSESTEQRAVEYPLLHPEPTTRQEHTDMQEHEECAERRHHTHHEA